MAGIRKYMFDLDFDPPTRQPRVEVVEEVRSIDEDDYGEAIQPAAPPPPPATFSEEELNLAREMAWEQGRTQGLTEAAETTERMIANALIDCAGQIDGLMRRQEEANEESARNAVRVAQAVLKKMLPAACESHGFEEVVRVVEEMVGHVLDEPRIIVKVSDGVADPVRERLEVVAQTHGFEGRVVVQVDPRLQPGDCRVEWTDGGAERDVQRLMSDLDAAIERSLAPPERRRQEEVSVGDGA